MRESQFAKNLTNGQICSFLTKIGFNNPIFVTKADVPAVLANFYKVCVSSSSSNWDETFYVFFKYDNRFYLMLYTDFYFTIYHIITFKDLTQDVTVIPHDPQMYKLRWNHFLYTIFQKDYEVFWWEERFASRQKLEESLNQRLRDFDKESEKTIKQIKNGKY
ncbi:MAG: hypothetical protein J6B87_07005 [Clostridia bacterium]|nr:hypothetical protein [Clostridia bacterium]